MPRFVFLSIVALAAVSAAFLFAGCTKADDSAPAPPTAPNAVSASQAAPASSASYLGTPGHRPRK